MSKRDWRLYFDDIFDCIKKIENYTANLSYDEFIRDNKTQDAVIRNLEVIGEAAKQVEENIKKKYNNIPWKEMVGIRNRIIHGYFGVDLEIIWQIINHDLRDLKQKIEKVLTEDDNK